LPEPPAFPILENKIRCIGIAGNRKKLIFLQGISETAIGRAIGENVETKISGLIKKSQVAFVSLI